MNAQAAGNVAARAQILMALRLVKQAARLSPTAPCLRIPENAAFPSSFAGETSPQAGETPAPLFGNGRVPPVLRNAREPKRWRDALWVILPLVSASVVAVAVLFSFDPNRYHFYPLCYFHQITGLLCPGCGGLRACHQLLHGHLAAAFRYNALVVCALPVVAWAGLRQIRRWLKTERSLFAVHPGWIWGSLAVALAFGVMRNLPVAAEFWLAP